MKFIDLFSGVGMYAKGIEDAGHEVIGFCEKDTFCQKILKKHWKTKPISSCVKLLTRGLISASLAVGRAKMSALRWEAPPWEFQENVLDYGDTYLEPFAWYDQKSRCWRTYQRCWIEGWARFLETWPQSGMIRNGIAYRQRPLDCPTKEKDFMQLPTPLASDYKGTSRKRYMGSQNFRSGRITEALRNCQGDPTYTHPQFAEAVMGLEKDYTLLETETRQK